MLKLSGVCVHYGRTQVLWDVDLSVEAGEIVAVMGPNGSGKSTVFKAITGLAPVTAGSITFEGRDITNRPAHEMVGHRISLVLERRRLFPRMSVRENVLLGAFTERSQRAVADRYAEIEAIFPIVREKAGDAASSLSGGQQQMVAIARGLMSRPRLLIMDEPFLGLTPLMVAQTMDLMRAVNRDGVCVLFNEQNARVSFANAHRGYVLQSGRILLTGSGVEMLEHPDVKSVYLGH